MKALMEAVKTYCLILDTRHHLDLLETLYVPNFSRNLISLSKLMLLNTILILVMDVSIYLSIIIPLILLFFVVVYIN